MPPKSTRGRGKERELTPQHTTPEHDDSLNSASELTEGNDEANQETSAGMKEAFAPTPTKTKTMPDTTFTTPGKHSQEVVVISEGAVTMTPTTTQKTGPGTTAETPTTTSKKTTDTVFATPQKRSREVDTENGPRTEREQSKDWLEEASQAWNFEQGWGAVIRGSSNFIQNLEWSRIFWRPTSDDKTTHVLGIKSRDGQESAQLWVIGEIAKEPALNQLDSFKNWHVELSLPSDQTRSLQDRLKLHGVLSQVWSRESVARQFYSSIKPGIVTKSIGLVEDAADREDLKRRSDHNVFPFTYDGKEDSNPGPGENPLNFIKGRLVAVEFQVHSRNLRTTQKPNGAFDYAFHLVSIYLVNRPAASVSTPKKRLKHMKELEWIEQPPRTKNSQFGENPLEFNMKKRALEDAMEDDDIEF